ncbi:hypothetical protein ACWF82_17240 [Nocardia sp. NPDC055053]
MDSVYLLEHTYTKEDGTEESKRIGVYVSEGAARAAAARLSAAPGFREYPDNFVVQRYTVDEDHWTSGFEELRL